jgi:hypothetical protein
MFGTESNYVIPETLKRIASQKRIGSNEMLKKVFW